MEYKLLSELLIEFPDDFWLNALKKTATEKFDSVDPETRRYSLYELFEFVFKFEFPAFASGEVTRITFDKKEVSDMLSKTVIPEEYGILTHLKNGDNWKVDTRSEGYETEIKMSLEFLRNNGLDERFVV